MLFLEFRGVFNFPSEDRSYLHIFLLHGISVFNLLNKYLLSNYSVFYHWGSKMNEYSCVFKGYSLVRRAALWTDDCIMKQYVLLFRGRNPHSKHQENSCHCPRGGFVIETAQAHLSHYPSKIITQDKLRDFFMSQQPRRT